MEIGELDFERDGAAANPGTCAISPYLADELAKRIPRRLVGEKIGGKRVLGADGFAYPIGPDGPLVDPARRPIVIGAGFPEMLLQKGLRLRLEIEPGCDAEPGHLPRRRGPDAVKLPDRQRLDE